MMILLRLFWSFMYVGVLALGGGYVALPLIQQQCVTDNGWLTATEFADLLTLSQITPGPIAINAATFVGTKVAGIPGALVATLGFLLPPFAVVTALWLVYRKYCKMDLMKGVLSGLRPAVVALIASAALSILLQALWGDATVSLSGTDAFAAVLVALGVFVLRKWRPDPVWVILGCGALGLCAEAVKNIRA